MCCYDALEMACKCWKWGHFREHCALEYRTGETCGLKLVMNRYQSVDKCQIRSTKRSIRKAEERLRRFLLEQEEQWERGNYISPNGRTPDGRELEDVSTREEGRIQRMKMEVVVLQAMLSNTADKSDFGICFCYFTTASSKHIIVSKFKLNKFLYLRGYEKGLKDTSLTMDPQFKLFFASPDSPDCVNVPGQIRLEASRSITIEQSRGWCRARVETGRD